MTKLNWNDMEGRVGASDASIGVYRLSVRSMWSLGMAGDARLNWQCENIANDEYGGWTATGDADDLPTAKAAAETALLEHLRSAYAEFMKGP